LRRTILIMITLVAVLFGVTGCKRERNAVTRKIDNKINVTVTIFPPYDFVRQIAGDRVHLSMLLPPGAEPHSFEPSPKDIITIQNSDVFLYIGGETDIWVDRILQSMNTDNMKILALMDAVNVVMEEDHEDETAYDAHIWTSPRNAILIVSAITELLCEADAANAAVYRENAAAYIEELVQLDAAFSEIVDGAQRKTIVFADRFPFRYFADAYGLSCFAAFPACSTETEPSAATVAFLINKIRAEKIPVVFHIELSNERMADTISGETGAKKLLLHSGHNVTKRDFDAGLDYLTLMRQNVVNLQEALY